MVFLAIFTILIGLTFAAAQNLNFHKHPGMKETVKVETKVFRVLPEVEWERKNNKLACKGAEMLTMPQRQHRSLL